MSEFTIGMIWIALIVFALHCKGLPSNREEDEE